MDWAHTNDIPSAAIRNLADVSAVRVNVTQLRGPAASCARVGDFFLFNDQRPVPIAAAIDEGVPAHVLSSALYERFSSRGDADFADKLLSAMRYEFGGHIEKKA